jgi:hypothetical protein
MKDPNLTNPIDIKLAALVARKKSENKMTSQISENKLWPSTLQENSVSHFSAQNTNYSAIMKTIKNYNG